MNAGTALQQRGVTLIELMFAIAVLAILLGIGAPSFANLVRDNRVSSMTNELVTTFALARSEAMKRGLPVTVCPSTDGDACDDTTDWSIGWILFTDDTGAPGVRNGPADELLQVVQGGAQGLVPAGYEVGGTVTFLRFAPNGLTDSNLPAANARVFSLKKSGCTGNYARELQVSRIGRLATTRVSC